ncbi:MAG: flagellar hook-basal body protein [Fimbriimonadaceae bacterium]
MERGIYATATGMIATQQWMDVVSNNLANASTVGFKRDSIAFDEAMLREMEVGKRPIGGLGSGPKANQTVTIFERGSLESTGNPLDLSIDSDHGLFAVQTPAGTRYTRAGDFTLNANRLLVTKSGYPVLDQQGRQITVPGGQPLVTKDGTLTVNDSEVARIGVFDCARASKDDLGFRKIGTNLYEALRPVSVMGDAKVQSGMLEGSNVNAVESMVQMIAISRSFELSQKSVMAQDELTQRLIQSLSDR